MRALVLVAFIICVCGCSDGDRGSRLGSGSSAAMLAPPYVRPESYFFRDEVFRVPIYPGSTPNRDSTTDMTGPGMRNRQRHYNTKDSLDQVEQFVKKEGAKIAKPASAAMGTASRSLERSGSFRFADGALFSFRAVKKPVDDSTEVTYSIQTRRHE